MVERWGRWLRAYAEKDGRGYPDWAVRYLPVVRRLGGRERRARLILEIGANEAGFARFARVRTIVTDISWENLRAARAGQNAMPVAADAAALPFPGATMDLCVCMDTFEHLADNARGKAVEQIAAILRPDGACVVGFPSGARAKRAEEVLRAEYLRATGRRLHWLEEHAADGLPDADEILEGFRAVAGGAHRVSRAKNATLWVWLWMWRILLCGWPGRGNALVQALVRVATPVLSRIHFGTCYRTLIWLEPK